jgi:putative sterol carrier protein
MKAKDFLENVLKPKLDSDPAVLSGSGLQSKSLALALDAGRWLLDFDAKGHVCLKVQDAQEANSTIEMSDETFEKMVQGSLNVPFAYMMRKIKVGGDMDVAVKFGLALQKLFKNAS